MIHMDGREVRVVKGIIILTLILLAGCAGYTSTEQLEAEALLSGDWSAVEKREQREARRNYYSSIRCAPGKIAYCEPYRTPNRCGCVNQKAIRAFFDSR